MYDNDNNRENRRQSTIRNAATEGEERERGLIRSYSCWRWLSVCVSLSLLLALYNLFLSHSVYLNFIYISQSRLFFPLPICPLHFIFSIFSFPFIFKLFFSDLFFRKTKKRNKKEHGLCGCRTIKFKFFFKKLLLSEFYFLFN